MYNEQSNEQPEMDSQEDQAQEAAEETTQEDLIEINGEKLSIEELKAGYLRQSDYTKKTQDLADMRKEILHSSLQSPQEEVSEDDKLVQDFIKQNGLLTKQEAEQLMKKQQQMTKDELEFEDYKRKYSPTAQQAAVIKSLGYTKDFSSMSWTKIHDQVYGDAALKKVVSRKSVGTSTKTGVKTGSSRLTRADLAAMPLEEYKKKSPQEWMAMIND